MDSLLPEHLQLIASYLDGDSYLTLAQTTQDNHEKMNEKSFLGAVTRLNKFPFLVVDASYYTYCWSQHFLTHHHIHNPDTFYDVLKRTLRSGKMTDGSRKTLQKEVASLMISCIKTNNLYAKAVLQAIQKRLKKYDDPIASEIASYHRLYDPIALNLDPIKTEEVRQVKVGNLEWLQENGVRQPSLCMTTAVCYHQHEVIFYLIEKYKNQVGSFRDSIDDYLDSSLDSRTARILLAAFPPPLHDFNNKLQHYAYYVTRNDDPELLEAFFDYLKPRVDEMSFFLFVHQCLIEILTNDCVRCFDFFLKKENKTDINFIVRHSIFLRRNYKIQRYFRLEKTWLDKALLFLR